MDNVWEQQDVWVSGATGAWGREIVKQLLGLPVARVVGYCRGEHRAYQLKEEMGKDNRLQIYLGDIRDGERVRRSLEKVTIAIHTAALKRVDSVTYSPTEMQDVNINGTIRIIEAIMDQWVERGFYISSDKACLPTTFYGATKLVAEMLWLSASDVARAEMTATRFGNALGSTGSVLEVWKEQLSKGDTITISDPLMTRYMITLPDAVEQILHYLIPNAQNGVLQWPDMPAVRIGTLAKAFAPWAAWNVTGNRGFGEKDHEMLHHATPEKTSETARWLDIQECQELIKKAYPGWRFEK